MEEKTYKETCPICGKNLTRIHVSLGSYAMGCDPCNWDDYNGEYGRLLKAQERTLNEIRDWAKEQPVQIIWNTTKEEFKIYAKAFNLLVEFAEEKLKKIKEEME